VLTVEEYPPGADSERRAREHVRSILRAASAAFSEPRSIFHSPDQHASQHYKSRSHRLLHAHRKASPRGAPGVCRGISPFLWW